MTTPDMPPLVLGGLVIAGLVTGCGSPSESAEPPVPATPAFDETVLATPVDPEAARGQMVYRENCATCHNRGKKGAPKMGDHLAWAERIVQGDTTLLTHALEGYIGPTGSEMPARGGVDELSDDDVRLAMQYLTAPVR